MSHSYGKENCNRLEKCVVCLEMDPVKLDPQLLKLVHLCSSISSSKSFFFLWRIKMELGNYENGNLVRPTWDIKKQNWKPKWELWNQYGNFEIKMRIFKVQLTPWCFSTCCFVNIIILIWNILDIVNIWILIRKYFRTCLYHHSHLKDVKCCSFSIKIF